MHGVQPTGESATRSLSKIDIENKRSELQRAEMALRVRRERLRRFSLAAPANGIVLTDRTELLAGSAISSGETLIEIADPAQWRVILEVSEKDVRRIRPGDAVDVEILALATEQNNHVLGHVENVGLQPSTDTRGMTVAGLSPPSYRVHVHLDSLDLTKPMHRSLRRGYAVHAKVLTSSGSPFSLFLERFREKSRALIR
jgi:multidrug resistance efflux pump